jgi:hypothetical protein
MAARNDSRRTRRRGRTVGNRPQNHPALPGQLRSSSALNIALKEIRARLDVAAAVATVVCGALKAQRADSDIEAATALQRCVCDVLFEQSERLARIASKLARAVEGAP